MIERTDEAIRASLDAGRCAACNHPVPTAPRRRRTCLCAACALELAWCSTCQRPKAHGEFHRDATNASGFDYHCRACKARRRPRVRSTPICGRSGCGRPCSSNGRSSWHRLCAECLTRFAWCSGCRKPRWRDDFARAIREGRRHAGLCLRCDRERLRATARSRESVDQRLRRIAAYARRNPAMSMPAIALALQVTLAQVRRACRRHGLTPRPAMASR